MSSECKCRGSYTCELHAFLCDCTRAPGPDHIALWCRKCAAETWWLEREIPDGEIQLGGRTVTYMRVDPVCRRCAVVKPPRLAAIQRFLK